MAGRSLQSGANNAVSGAHEVVAGHQQQPGGPSRWLPGLLQRSEHTAAAAAAESAAAAAAAGSAEVIASHRPIWISIGSERHDASSGGFEYEDGEEVHSFVWAFAQSGGRHLM